MTVGDWLFTAGMVVAAVIAVAALIAVDHFYHRHHIGGAINLNAALNDLLDAARHVSDDDVRHHHLVECAIHFKHADDAAGYHIAARDDELDQLRAGVVDYIAAVYGHDSAACSALLTALARRTRAATHKVAP